MCMGTFDQLHVQSEVMLSQKFWSGEKKWFRGPQLPFMKEYGSVLKVVSTIREPRYVTRKEKQSSEVAAFP